ncbi:MAG: single-stranded DNA-binding protein [Leptolyngbya sp. SIO4C1]|nr:single-stranded DNA-binding protein [Leptolyngbya sp. SIO4C1]
MATNNLTTLTGNLGADPEIRTNSNGQQYVRLSIATTDSYKDQNGQWQQKAPVWHTAFAFTSSAVTQATSQRKGNRVTLEGSLSYRRQEAIVDGRKRVFRDASLVIHRIEAASLPR